MAKSGPGRGERGPKRKAYVPSKRDMEIFDLRHTTRMSLQEIADRYEISNGRVSQICNRVQEWTKLKHMDDAMLIKAKSTRIYEKVLIDAYESFERSKRTKRKTRNKTVRGGGENGDKDEYEEIDEDSHGDPNFLKIVLEAQGRIDKAWGIDQPPEIIVSATTRVAGSTPQDAVLALQHEIQMIIAGLPNAQAFLENMKPQGGGDVIDGNVIR